MLQELLAPADGTRFGDKSSLKGMINDIARIAGKALKGQYLSEFSVDKRMSWAKHRSTKIEEDHIYSLLDIFDLSMPLIYGEGRNKASQRLHEEIDKYIKSE
jgi:hypothetical protein